MEKSMLGEAGYFTSLPRKTLEHMIDVVKGIEPEVGYGLILQLSQAEADMRMVRTEKTKTVCTYCGVGCTFDIWHRDRQVLKVEPHEGPANGISTCVKGKFGGSTTLTPATALLPHSSATAISSASVRGTRLSTSSPAK